MRLEVVEDCTTEDCQGQGRWLQQPPTLTVHLRRDKHGRKHCLLEARQELTASAGRPWVPGGQSGDAIILPAVMLRSGRQISLPGQSIHTSPSDAARARRLRISAGRMIGVTPRHDACPQGRSGLGPKFRHSTTQGRKCRFGRGLQVLNVFGTRRSPAMFSLEGRSSPCGENAIMSERTSPRLANRLSTGLNWPAGTISRSLAWSVRQNGRPLCYERAALRPHEGLRSVRKQCTLF